jgi:formiminotetrahydrofolate cyclodeaminase
LVRAAEIPLEIASAGADAAALARSIAEQGDEKVRGDAVAAALLASAAARAAANLVSINLAAGVEHELVARAKEVAEDAADAARFVLDF